MCYPILVTHNSQQHITGHLNSVSACAFHPKKPIFATASDDETWRLWTLPNCELVMSGTGELESLHSCFPTILVAVAVALALAAAAAIAVAVAVAVAAVAAAAVAAAAVAVAVAAAAVAVAVAVVVSVSVVCESAHSESFLHSDR